MRWRGGDVMGSNPGRTSLLCNFGKVIHTSVAACAVIIKQYNCVLAWKDERASLAAAD